MIKIQINSIYGSLLFEYEKENNTIKKTLEYAVKRGVYLRGADLQGADLRGVSLHGADLRGADLHGADLHGADLQGVYLQGVYLRGADLQGADLQGVRIKKAVVFTGLYKYIVIAFISESDEKWIKLGCFCRTLSEWESDFWNNKKEFPNDNSEASQMRLLAFDTCKKWFEIVK